MDTFSIFTHSLEQTGAIAQKIAPHLTAGDTILLSGDLAAGKTYFVKLLAAALGSTDAVTSPTYTLANFYGTNSHVRILHMDVYRLSGVPAVEQLALDDFFEDCITLIEWGETIAEMFPEHLSVNCSIPDTDSDTSRQSRQIAFSYTGKRWEAAFNKIKTNLSDFQQNQT